MPMALAATMGREASKVFMAPLKPLLPLPRCTSGSPSTLSAGMRQLSRMKETVSLARMPSFSSVLTISMPGVPASTTKGFMPARPALLSTVAHTTTSPSDSAKARPPLVTKIFWPLRIHSLVAASKVAVVWMLLVSDPAWGSVMAMAPHLGSPSVKRRRKRSFCSSVPTAVMAEPANWVPGMHRYMPASPQLSISTM